MDTTPDAMTKLPCTHAGWTWYCDTHDTHGNADTEYEAIACASAHADYQRRIFGDDECDVLMMHASWTEARHYDA